MKVLALLALVSLCHASYSQHTLDWGFAPEHFDGRESVGNSVSIDDQNNIYVLGAFNGLIDADPGPATLQLDAQGDHNLLLQKLDEDGNLLWVKQFPGNFFQYGLNLDIDPVGNLIISGIFQDSIDVDPSATSNLLYGNGTTDGFLIKLDNNGEFIWSKHFDALPGSGNFALNHIATDANGAIYAIGDFLGEVNFDSSVQIASQRKAFLIKLSSNGTEEWLQLFGENGSNQGRKIQCRANGTISIGMDLGGSISLNNGAFVFASLGSTDGLIIDLDANGNVTNAYRFGGPGSNTIEALSEDSQGNLIVSGTFTATIDLDPGSDTYSASAESNEDAYFVKMNLAGEMVWAKSTFARPGTIQSVWITVPQNSDVDAFDNIYFVGAYIGKMDLDPGPDSTFLPTSDGGDGFLLQLDKHGNFLWGGSLNGAFFTHYTDISLDASNNVIATGVFFDSLDFDPGPGVVSYHGNGNDQMLVQKLNPPDILQLSESDHSSFSAFPNPTTGNVTVILNAKETSVVYTIRSLEGKIWRSEQLQNTDAFQIDLPDTSGVYLVEITTPNSKEVLRIVKK